MPPTKQAAAKQQPATRSRLVVEPLDTWLDSPVTLRTTSELSSTPPEQASAQRTEAAALWKALNAQPQELAQDSERLKTLEGEMNTLRGQASRDRAAAAQLQQQLEQAEQERFPAIVVYVLGGLLLLALLIVVWTWTRLRSASEKAVQAWRDSVALGNRQAAAAHEAALGLTPHPGDNWEAAETLPTPPGMVPGASAPAPLAGHAASPAAPLVSAPAPLAVAPRPVATSASAPASAMHIVNPEELFDIQQQAEFFISVGEHQQAIEVLKQHIADHRETSPLAYLELLRLYHTLSRVEEFMQLRTQFMQSFNAQVPEFSGFHRTGRMLYHYTDALAEIESQWTSPLVLELLEKFLFRREGDEAMERFDLAAYDDLLLLLAIAQTTPASARGEPAPRKRTTPLAPPRADTLVAEPATDVLARPAAAPASESLSAGLDFDFDLVPHQSSQDAGTLPQTPAAPSPVVDTRDMPLDLDLSEPPHLTLSDLPPVPVTAPPPAGQPVGFGMENDLMELRLELEQRKTEPK